MIDIVEFIDRLTDLTKKNQNAFDTGKDITGKINMAQNKLAELLYSIFEVNQGVSDLASPVTVTFTGTSSASGILPYPENYNHLLSLRYLKTPTQPKKCQRIGVNQLGIIDKIPQRRADLTKDRVLYSIQSDGVQVYPEQALSFKGIYAKYPPDASISYTYTNINGEPKRTVASQTNLVWNKNVYNLLLYMVMDEMGIASRDLILNEYARLGIQQEAPTIKN